MFLVQLMASFLAFRDKDRRLVFVAFIGNYFVPIMFLAPPLFFNEFQCRYLVALRFAEVFVYIIICELVVKTPCGESVGFEASAVAMTLVASNSLLYMIRASSAEAAT